jgi:hypothetical protein
MDPERQAEIERPVDGQQALEIRNWGTVVTGHRFSLAPVAPAAAAVGEDRTPQRPLAAVGEDG